jgi:hypothetical protein
VEVFWLQVPGPLLITAYKTGWPDWTW